MIGGSNKKKMEGLLFYLSRFTSKFGLPKEARGLDPFETASWVEPALGQAHILKSKIDRIGLYNAYY